MESLQIGRKEQVVVNGHLASVLLFAEICVFVLTHAITTVMSCDESDVSVEFLYQQLSVASEFACPISFSIP